MWRTTIGNINMGGLRIDFGAVKIDEKCQITLKFTSHHAMVGEVPI